ncbi:hypothetical protein KP509_07G036800 [Ceratopteris richardii]|uniref:Uncharacterized protein n=1 Tax=Ceratopteris richardii TaxID=49495 RepID=A0A8T2UK75_CERRI|nr:hypothetical protein KP509_07G036800 [Ceratopteris richardii]
MIFSLHLPGFATAAIPLSNFHVFCLLHRPKLYHHGCNKSLSLSDVPTVGNAQMLLSLSKQSVRIGIICAPSLQSPCLLRESLCSLYVPPPSTIQLDSLSTAFHLSLPQ